MKSRSVMCHGNVRFIEDMDEKRRILDIIMQQYVDYEFKSVSYTHLDVYKRQASALAVYATRA